MADSGTSFAIDLAVGGATAVVSAADQLDRFAAKLDFASKSAADASAAVKAGESSYKQAETAYDRASKSLERVNVAMQSASGKTLDRLVARQADAAKAVQVAKAALDGESTALDKLRTSAAAADKEVEGLTKAQTAAKKAIDAQKKSQADAMAGNEALASSLGMIGGPLGAVGQKAFSLKGAWDKMGKTLGAAGPYVAIAVAFVAIATAMAAVTVAAIAGVAQIAAWAVGLSDVARSNTLLAAGMVKSAAGGEELSAVIDDITKAVPQTREEVASMAAELAKTGLRGEALYKTLQKNAETAAAAKFGPEWQLQMFSLEQSQKRLKAGFNGLFSGLKIDALLEGLSSLVDLFDESNASGQAIKVVFESMFQPIVDGASGLVPVVRHAFLQFEILALKALIAIKPWGSTIVKVGEVIAVVSGVMLGIFAVAIGVVVGLVAALAAVIVGPIALFAALTAGVVYLGVKIIELGASLVGTLANFSLIDTGKNLIAGLAAGVTAGAQFVVDAVTSAANGAINAAKKALGIASPSKVFAEIGAYTGEGMQQGVEASTGGVEAAMGELVAPPSPAASQGAGASAASASSGGNTFHITIQGGGAEDIAEKVRQIILDTIEGASIQMGTAAPA